MSQKLSDIPVTITTLSLTDLMYVASDQGGGVFVKRKMEIPTIGGSAFNKPSLGTTPFVTLTADNNTPAALGAQQYSPAIQLTAQGFATTPVASQTTKWRFYNQTVQGAANPATNLIFESSTDGGAFATRFTITNLGQIFTPASVNAFSDVTASVNVVAGAAVAAGTFVSVPAAGQFLFLTRAAIDSRASGSLTFYNAAGTDFTSLNLGGNNSSFPSIGRNGIFLEFLAADGSSKASTALYNTKTSSTNFERLTTEWNTNVLRLWTEKGSGGGTARDFVLGADATEVMRLTSASATFAKNLLFGSTTIAGVKLNNLTTAQRDAVSPAAAAGNLIWNTDTSRMEVYIGASWKNFVRLDGDTMTGVLQFSGTTHPGLRVNNLTTAQRDAASPLAAGDLVWNTTASALNVYDGAAWQLAATGSFLPLAGGTMTGSILFTDNSFDIGATTATRPRTAYFATSVQIEKSAIGTTPTDSLILLNSTAAANGAQQNSTAIRLTGFGWGTTASTSQELDWRIYSLSTQSTVPTTTIKFDAAIAGGAYSTIWQMSNLGATKYFAPAASTSGQVGLSLVGDGVSRVALETPTNALAPGGRISFGDGASSRDVGLSRTAAGTLLMYQTTTTTNPVSLGLSNTSTSLTSYELLRLNWVSNVAQIWTEKGSGGGTARAMVLGADATELMRFGSSTTLSFFAATAVVKQTSGENLTNSVTSGGTDGTIANYTDLTIYANDAAAIRNDIYQLARKLKQINDGLRSYGLFT